MTAEEVKEEQTPKEEPKKTTSSGTGLEPNVASMLAYAPYIGWVASIIFILVEKDKEVKFNSFQSLALDVAYLLFIIVWGFITSAITVASLTAGSVSGFGVGILLGTLTWVIGVAYLVFKIVLMVKAYQGVKWELPVVGKIAKNFVK